MRKRLKRSSHPDVHLGLEGDERPRFTTPDGVDHQIWFALSRLDVLPLGNADGSGTLGNSASSLLLHLTQKDIERVVGVILEQMIESLEGGGRVELRGFGAFSVRGRPARAGGLPLRPGRRLFSGSAAAFSRCRVNAS